LLNKKILLFVNLEPNSKKVTQCLNSHAFKSISYLESALNKAFAAVVDLHLCSFVSYICLTNY